MYYINLLFVVIVIFTLPRITLKGEIYTYLGIAILQLVETEEIFSKDIMKGQLQKNKKIHNMFGAQITSEVYSTN